MIGICWVLPFQTRVYSLLLYLPVLAARLIVHRRLWSRTPLDLPLIALFVLANVNYRIAPFTWGWEMCGRIIMGIIIFQILADLAQHKDRLLLATGLIAVLVGGIALLTSHWIPKSSVLFTLAQSLPKWNGLPGAEGGFNVNEIGGAMTWLLPFAFAMVIYELQARTHRVRLIVYAVAFALLSLAVALGQSRMAIAGVLIVMLGQAALLIPRRTWKLAVCAAIIGLIVLEIGLVTGVFDSAADTQPDGSGVALNERDEQSASTRLDIWSAGLRAVRDYPLTGVGINKFRGGDVRALYPVPGYERNVLPHAHNELLHVALDMGIPGLIVYIGLHAALGVCLIRVWRRGERAAAVAVAGGVIAHAIFGLADAVTLADRFIWVYWWLIGLGAALYIQTTSTSAKQTSPPNPLSEKREGEEARV